MSTTRIQEGILGEQAAAAFLQKLGYTILARNYKIRYGEIDIVALDPSAGSACSLQSGSGQASSKEKTLVFVEVKTRSSAEFGSPLEAITSWKLRAVIKTAEYYVLTHKNLPQLLRIDAISVKISGDGTIQEIEHIKNISQ